MKGNIQKTYGKEEEQEEQQTGAVDQIRKRYGFSSSSNVSIYIQSMHTQLNYAWLTCYYITFH